MNNSASTIIEQLNLDHSHLNKKLPEGHEVAIFMETFAGKFRVLRLDSLPTDVIRATVLDQDRKTRRYCLLFAGQAIWSVQTVPVEGERVPLGFGQISKQPPVA
jgi:hypothetical protein